MSEIGAIFLSAVASSFVVTLLLIASVAFVYHLILKCMLAYIAFDKIADRQRKERASNTRQS